MAANGVIGTIGKNGAAGNLEKSLPLTWSGKGVMDSCTRLGAQSGAHRNTLDYIVKNRKQIQ